MDQNEEIKKTAIKNYANSDPWPEHDTWHHYTYSLEKHIVEKWLEKYSTNNMRILNAGSGGTEYKTKGHMIHLDIIEKYICDHNDYIVGSIENIDLPDNAVDGIICVGSVLNYCDAQRAIAEFSRILKPQGFYIVEFERSNSAEFLWTSEHGKYIFYKEYSYNEQIHPLWLYSEKHIRDILSRYNLHVEKCKRVHSLSTFLNRLGVSEEKAAPYANLDPLFQPLSYPLAHNVLLFGRKKLFAKRYN